MASSAAPSVISLVAKYARDFYGHPRCACPARRRGLSLAIFEWRNPVRGSKHARAGTSWRDEERKRNYERRAREKTMIMRAVYRDPGEGRKSSGDGSTWPCLRSTLSMLCQHAFPPIPIPIDVDVDVDVDVDSGERTGVRVNKCTDSVFVDGQPTSIVAIRKVTVFRNNDKRDALGQKLTIFRKCIHIRVECDEIFQLIWTSIKNADQSEYLEERGQSRRVIVFRIELASSGVRASTDRITRNSGAVNQSQSSQTTSTIAPERAAMQQPVSERNDQ